MPDAMESTRSLSRLVYIAFALRNEPERKICRVARRFGVHRLERTWPLFRHRVLKSYFFSTTETRMHCLWYLLYIYGEQEVTNTSLRRPGLMVRVINLALWGDKNCHFLRC
jgi:hypothetical protein